MTSTEPKKDRRKIVIDLNTGSIESWDMPQIKTVSKDFGRKLELYLDFDSFFASRDEALIEQINSLPSYEVQDDVKTESGEWEEFFQVKVLRKEDILALIRSSREG